MTGPEMMFIILLFATVLLGAVWLCEKFIKVTEEEYDAFWDEGRGNGEEEPEEGGPV